MHINNTCVRCPFSSVKIENIINYSRCHPLTAPTIVSAPPFCPLCPHLLTTYSSLSQWDVQHGRATKARPISAHIAGLLSQQHISHPRRAIEFWWRLRIPIHLPLPSRDWSTAHGLPCAETPHAGKLRGIQSIGSINRRRDQIEEKVLTVVEKAGRLTAEKRPVRIKGNVPRLSVNQGRDSSCLFYIM